LHTLMERSEGLSYSHIKGGYVVFFFGRGGGFLRIVAVIRMGNFVVSSTRLLPLYRSALEK
jgi:hypothetical protein